MTVEQALARARELRPGCKISDETCRRWLCEEDALLRQQLFEKSGADEYAAAGADLAWSGEALPDDTVLLVPVLLLAPELTAFFNQKPEVVSYGALLLRLLSPFYFFFCINQVYSAALRGAGNSQVPMWIMLGSFVVFRQIYLYIVAHYVSNEIIPIALSYPAGWFLCSAATLIYYSRCRFDKHRLVEDV